ncbi:MAG: hypothetical protein ACJATF_000917 [Flavobacteriales bacterium]|jgi:hypothetical protein
MKMKLYTSLFMTALGFFLLSSPLNAQINFTNSNLLLPSTNYSGVAIGVTDVNGDNLDDIVRFSNGSNLSVLYQSAAGTEYTETNIGASGSGKQWTLSIADTDHNGFGDILTGGYSASQIDMADSSGVSFSASNLPGNFFAQGSNFVDINNDGFLDVFVCNDDGESFMYENDGSGGFTNANDWIDMAIDGNTGEPSSGNYGSVWSDFDNDGDTDLYIAHCRLGVSSEFDERRINKLFVNDGNNNYTEQGAEHGLRIGWQSWTAEFQDIDNDGDYDCFVTNHDYPSQLLLNDGAGHFTDITPESGIVINGIAIQGFMRDFDNDGYVDVIVAGTQQYIYRNNGDLTFTAVDTPFDNNEMESCAIGDLNNDGHLDIYAGYAETYNNPSNIEDVLWLNDGNDNNWFKAHLVGTASNLDGIGARVEIHGPFGMQVREVRSGEGYGITNTAIPHFGLGTFDQIDHVVVKWPSGIVDVIENPTINGLAEIIEGECLPTSPVIIANGSTSFCPGGSVDLMAPTGAEYFWSNGANTQMITVDEPGNYSVVVGDGSGCHQWSQVINVTVEADQTPEISVLGQLSFCEGSSVELMASEAASYDWSNGEISQSIMVTEAGEYTVTIAADCGDFTSSAVQVTVLPIATQAQSSDVFAFLGEDATFEATGDNIRWYDAQTDGNLLGQGPIFTIPNVSGPATFYVENSLATLDYMEPHEYEGNSPYSSANFNGDLYFNVEADMAIKSVKVYTDQAGERMFEVRNSAGTVLDSRLVNVPVGESRVELNFILSPGNNYRLGTNTNTNLQNLGTQSPRLQRSNQNVTFPYSINNLVDIIGTSLSANRYYYFYDWEVQSPGFDCIDDRVVVELSVGVSTNNLQNTDLVNVYPNPGNGLLQLELNLVTESAVLSISDVTGRTLLSKDLGAVGGLTKTSWDATTLSPGTYMLEVQTKEERFFGKLIVQ